MKVLEYSLLCALVVITVCEKGPKFEEEISERFTTTRIVLEAIDAKMGADSIAKIQITADGDTARIYRSRDGHGEIIGQAKEYRLLF